MGLKIRWNDDRVRAAMTAVLLISRDHLVRGDTENLIEKSLRSFREDPDTYKRNKAGWPDAKDIGPLTDPRYVAYYTNLIAAVERLHTKMEQGKRQSNSLLELDNYLIFSLKNVR